MVGGGPAGLAAARAAAEAGAKTVVLERAAYPRYKTCGGGLIGTSIAAIEHHVTLPARDQIHTATFTLRGAHSFTRRSDDALLTMVLRDEFDDALRLTAVAAGAVVRQRSVARSIHEDGDYAYVRLADGTEVRATVVVGADGSSGVSARYVNVEFAQVDLGLELEIAAPESVQKQWRQRVLLDWGPIPGSYAWVFPKSDRLTVGVIASRGQGEQTKQYLRDFVDRLGLSSFEPIQDSGHLTRCRSDRSPLRKGRVLVAGDAAGLLEPWTREGISFALRSGTLAGKMGAEAAICRRERCVGQHLDKYIESINQSLVPEIQAGRLILSAFSRHPSIVHASLASPPGWRAFTKFCRGSLTFSSAIKRPLVAPTLSFLAKR